MAFPPEFLDEIRARITLAELVGRRVQLKKRGREFEGLCPFHNEKTPSFTVSEEKGFFHCFGCGAHGDAFGFVMQSEGLSFPETVEKLAGEAGLAVPQEKPGEVEARRHRKGIHDALELTCGWFEAQLVRPGGAEALAYLLGRGLERQTIAQFRLGFAPNQRGLLQKTLNAQGVTNELLIEAGLLKKPDDGGPLRDYFFNRVIFPIEDRRGRVIAFGGRALGDSKAKYLNSPETLLFQKGRVLYNLARARQAAHDTGELVVTEGYMDVIALSQAGFPAAVAPLGTAVTETQIAELWRLVKEPLICLDGDAAGRRAGLRAALTALPELSPDRSLDFAILPEGDDPDSLVARQGPTALRQVLDGAITLCRLLWLAETESRKFDTPERRAGLWNRLQAVIAKINDQAIRELYQAQFEEYFEHELGYNPRSRRRVFGSRPGQGSFSQGSLRDKWMRGRTQGGLGLQRSPKGLTHRREQALLVAAINHPHILAEFAENLAGLRLSSPDLARLAQTLVDLISETPDLDSEALKGHLCEQGYSKVLEGLLSRQVYELERWVRPETPLSEVHPRWVHFLALHRDKEAELETAQAARLLAEDTSEEHLAWLRARQRSVEGGERKRVEFETLDSAEPNDSN